MLLVLVCRWIGPDDLDGNDQAKQALYVLDIREEGRWILPRERGMLPATKPPLYPWLAAIASLPLAKPDEFSCRLPSMLASLAVAGLIYLLGAERFGPRVGLAAAWIFTAVHPAFRLCIHVRPDMALTVLTTASLLSLARIERGRARGMAALFWSAVSLSTLAKGPAGPVVIFGSMLGLCVRPGWRRITWRLLLSPWIALVALPVAWFLLALWEGGESYLADTLANEVSSRAPITWSGTWESQHPGQLLLFFLGRCAPWSWFAIFASVGVLVAGRKTGAGRGLGLLIAWTFMGLLILNLFRGQREDYLLPLLPAASLLVAAALADPPFRAFARIWDLAAAAAAAVFLLLGISCLAEFSFGVPAIRQMEIQGGWPWGLGLLGAAGLFGMAAVRGLRAGGHCRIGAASLAAVPALIILLACYQFTLSPDAISGGGRATREFTAQVKRQMRPGEEILLFGPVRNALCFLLGINTPYLTKEEIGEALRDALGRRRPGNRLFIISDQAGAAEVERRWPGRFRELIRRSLAGKNRGYILLESVDAAG